MFDLRQRVNGRPLLVGHRGALEVAPENTMASFAAGVAGGADILELDVQLTADGEVVVFHDGTLQAKTGVAGRVAEYPLSFIRTLDVGAHFAPEFARQSIPLLADVLAWARGRVPLMIELKHGPIFEPALDAATVALIEDFGMVDEVVITSFDQYALQRVRRLNPQIATSFIYIARVMNPVQLVDGLGVHAISPATDFLTAADVKAIQDAGYACSPGGLWWDYPTLLAWGIDTVSSNNPAAVDMAALLAARA